jgi:hypothetical protein
VRKADNGCKVTPADRAAVAMRWYASAADVCSFKRPSAEIDFSAPGEASAYLKCPRRLSGAADAAEAVAGGAADSDALSEGVVLNRLKVNHPPNPIAASPIPLIHNQDGDRDVDVSELGCLKASGISSYINSAPVG